MRGALVLGVAAVLVGGTLCAAAGPVSLPGCTGDTSKMQEIVVRPERVSAGQVAIVLSGDGGWRDIDRRLSRDFTSQGVPVVGVEMSEYLSKERTPEETACDLDRLIRSVSADWDNRSVILVGYSRGADALALVLGRLPLSTRLRISVVALLGPAREAQLRSVPLWKFWASNDSRTFPLPPGAVAATGVPLVCVFGKKETESLCRDLSRGRATVIETSGGRHFGGAYDVIAREILKLAR